MNDIVERLRLRKIAHYLFDEAADEIERLQTENWQLKQACGYPIPADKETINNPFKCGICDARADEIERLREHLFTIKQWSEAYPETAFPEPDLKRAHELLQVGGMTLDAVSADAMRHVVKSVGEIARRALEKPV